MKNALPALAALALMMPVMAQVPATAKMPENPLRAELKQPVIKWTCVHDGQRKPQGSKACLDTHQGPRMATCGKVLNNSHWFVSKNSCTITG